MGGYVKGLHVCEECGGTLRHSSRVEVGVDPLHPTRKLYVCSARCVKKFKKRVRTVVKKSKQRVAVKEVKPVVEPVLSQSERIQKNLEQVPAKEEEPFFLPIGKSARVYWTEQEDKYLKSIMSLHLPKMIAGETVVWSRVLREALQRDHPDWLKQRTFMSYQTRLSKILIAQGHRTRHYKPKREPQVTEAQKAQRGKRVAGLKHMYLPQEGGVPKAAKPTELPANIPLSTATTYKMLMMAVQGFKEADDVGALRVLATEAIKGKLTSTQLHNVVVSLAYYLGESNDAKSMSELLQHSALHLQDETESLAKATPPEETPA